MGWVYDILFIHLSLDGHFYFLAVVINAAMNIAIQVSVRVLALNFLGYIRVELLVPRVIVCLAFLGTTKLYPMMAASFYIPSAKYEDSNFSISLPLCFLKLYLSW